MESGLLVALLICLHASFRSGIISSLTHTIPFTILKKNVRSRYLCQKLTGNKLVACRRSLYFTSQLYARFRMYFVAQCCTLSTCLISSMVWGAIIKSGWRSQGGSYYSEEQTSSCSFISYLLGRSPHESQEFVSFWTLFDNLLLPAELTRYPYPEIFFFL